MLHDGQQAHPPSLSRDVDEISGLKDCALTHAVTTRAFLDSNSNLALGALQLTEDLRDRVQALED